MKRLKTIFLLLCLPIMLTAKEYYVATNGDDANTGSIDSPFATLARAQAEVKAGDIVYIRGGRYIMEESQIMGEREKIYACVFLMTKAERTTSTVSVTSVIRVNVRYSTSLK